MGTGEKLVSSGPVEMEQKLNKNIDSIRYRGGKLINFWGGGGG